VAVGLGVAVEVGLGIGRAVATYTASTSELRSLLGMTSFCPTLRIEVTLMLLTLAISSAFTPYLEAILSRNSPSLTTCTLYSMAVAVGLGSGGAVAVGTENEMTEGVAGGLDGLAATLLGRTVDVGAADVAIARDCGDAVLDTVKAVVMDATARDGTSVDLAMIVDSYQGLISQMAATTTPSASRPPTTLHSLPNKVERLIWRRAPQIGQLASVVSMRAPHSGQCSDSTSRAER